MKIVYSIRLHKLETYHIRITIGSNALDYNNNTKALTDNLITIILLLNSMLSIPGAKLMIIDIKIFI